MKRVSLFLLALLTLPRGGLCGQEPVAILGRLLDAGSDAAIEGATVELVDFGVGAITDSEGEFQLRGVAPGVYQLRVRHLGYGEHTEEVDVPADVDLALELRLSPQALELEPIDVEILRPVRTATTRSNVVTREQIAAVADRARHIGDVVRTFIPGAAVTESRGGYLCLEFRGARASRISGCNFPLVILDGLPVTEPARFLRDLQVDDLERIEFVPASEGGARYGLDATYGVLVIETRRSTVTAEPRKVESPRYPSYDWSVEGARHPKSRALAGASLGTFTGALVGLAAIGCVPGASGSGGRCINDAGAGAGLAASLLPLAGSALGARLFGRTEGSEGSLLPSLAMTALPSLLGYLVYVEGVKTEFDGQLYVGGALLLVATPLVSTLADNLFRKAR
jgi:hypothetical protein